MKPAEQTECQEPEPIRHFERRVMSILSSKALRYTLYSVSIFCICGLVVSLLGQILHQPLVARIGTGLFLCGPVALGFIFGGIILFVNLYGLRIGGFRLVRARPFYLLLHFVGSLVFILMSFGLLWVAVSEYFFPK
jgi:hypothetical protein